MSWAVYIFPLDGSEPYIYQTMTDEEVKAISQQIAEMAKKHFWEICGSESNES